MIESTRTNISNNKDGNSVIMYNGEQTEELDQVFEGQGKHNDGDELSLPSPPPLVYGISDMSNASTISSSERPSLMSTPSSSSILSFNASKRSLLGLRQFDSWYSSQSRGGASASFGIAATPWSCKQCSYKNSDLYQSTCALCGTTRHKPKKVVILEGIPKKCCNEIENDNDDTAAETLDTTNHSQTPPSPTEKAAAAAEREQNDSCSNTTFDNGTVTTGTTAPTIRTSQTTVKASNTKKESCKPQKRSNQRKSADNSNSLLEEARPSLQPPPASFSPNSYPSKVRPKLHLLQTKPEAALPVLSSSPCNSTSISPLHPPLSPISTLNHVNPDCHTPPVGSRQRILQQLPASKIPVQALTPLLIKQSSPKSNYRQRPKPQHCPERTSTNLNHIHLQSKGGDRPAGLLFKPNHPHTLKNRKPNSQKPEDNAMQAELPVSNGLNNLHPPKINNNQARSILQQPEATQGNLSASNGVNNLHPSKVNSTKTTPDNLQQPQAMQSQPVPPACANNLNSHHNAMMTPASPQRHFLEAMPPLLSRPGPEQPFEERSISPCNSIQSLDSSLRMIRKTKAATSMTRGLPLHNSCEPITQPQSQSQSHHAKSRVNMIPHDDPVEKPSHLHYRSCNVQVQRVSVPPPVPAPISVPGTSGRIDPGNQKPQRRILPVKFHSFRLPRRKSSHHHDHDGLVVPDASGFATLTRPSGIRSAPPTLIPSRPRANTDDLAPPKPPPMPLVFRQDQPQQEHNTQTHILAPKPNKHRQYPLKAKKDCPMSISSEAASTTGKSTSSNGATTHSSFGTNNATVTSNSFHQFQHQKQKHCHQEHQPPPLPLLKQKRKVLPPLVAPHQNTIHANTLSNNEAAKPQEPPAPRQRVGNKSSAYPLNDKKATKSSTRSTKKDINPPKSRHCWLPFVKTTARVSAAATTTRQTTSRQRSSSTSRQRSSSTSRQRSSSTSGQRPISTSMRGSSSRQRSSSKSRSRSLSRSKSSSRSTSRPRLRPSPPWPSTACSF